jgi:carbonic anhydrase
MNNLPDTHYAELLENNRRWVAEKRSADAQYFQKMAAGQSPKFLFIGCSDSRVPETEITQAEPGDIFVHRNVANLVVNTDLNLHSVVEYAVEYLKVEHIIVCGHYGCGGVKAAMSHQHFGLIDKWLRNIKDVYRLHRKELQAIIDEKKRFDRLVELNVVEQVHNLYKSYIIQKVWEKDSNLHIHGWVYDLHEGLIKDLNVQPGKDFDFDDAIFDLDFNKE